MERDVFSQEMKENQAILLREHHQLIFTSQNPERVEDFVADNPVHLQTKALHQRSNPILQGHSHTLVSHLTRLVLLAPETFETTMNVTSGYRFHRLMIDFEKSLRRHSE